MQDRSPLVLAVLMFSLGSTACKDSGSGNAGGVVEPLPEFTCQYTLARNEQDLLRQGREKALAGEDMETLLKHAEKCLSEAP